ncbi:MAG TPA: hypothetical protein PK239_08535 [Chitinophagales bacterium]|nr:hypothetical protein [Chitinophagales bacterium]HRK27322.1 hypothetical protein [Chitinophagales bacterium]
MISRLTFLLIIVAYLWSFAYYSPWKTGHIIGGGDSWGYYAYLPAMFIYHDLDSLHRTVAKRYEYAVNHSPAPDNPLGVHEAHPTQNGRQVFKYTMGVALLQIPFFQLAHVWAKLSSHPPDGYSFPYLLLILFSGTFYALLGLYFVRKLLLHFFSDTITALVLVAVALGSNLYYFSVYNPGMSHAYLFALYAGMLYATVHFYRRQQLILAFIVGLTCGFITVIRPVEIICVLLPLLYGERRLGYLQNQLNFWKQNMAAIAAAIGGAIVAGLPQLLYWKAQSGKWLYYSYKGESFDFLHPHIKGGLLSFSNGWLIYTPIMVLALAGFWWLYRRQHPFAIGAMLFLPLHIYFAYSWWCWYYINGFGSRPMVETYALLAIPMAYTFSVLHTGMVKRVILAVLLLFFTGLNLFQTYQLSLGVMWSEVANSAFYRAIFGKTHLDRPDLVMFDSGEWQPDNLRLAGNLYHNTFEDTTFQSFATDTISYNNSKSYYLTGKQEFSPGMAATLDSLKVQGGKYLRVSAKCYSPVRVYSWYDMSRLVVEMRSEKPKFKKWRAVRIQSKLGNDNNSLWGGKAKVWEEVSMLVKVPHNAPPGTMVKVYALNNSSFPIYLDDLKVEIWEKQ